MRVLSLTFLVLIPWLMFGQPYPVTAIVQVTQFSPYPEAYADPGRVIVTLLSTDVRAEYPALLRLQLSGPGFSLRTPDTYLPPPVMLRRNQPLVLTGAQLRELLPTAGAPNLDPLGILPAGPVSLCVEVYDYQRFFDPPVSNTACAQGLIQLHRS